MTDTLPQDTLSADRRELLMERMHQWHCGHLLRAALLPACEAAHQQRSVRVWGSDAARRAICGLLQDAGAPVDPSSAGAKIIRRTPVRDFVLVATAAHEGPTEQLESLGFRRGTDYSVLEPQILHALSVRDRIARDAA